MLWIDQQQQEAAEHDAWFRRQVRVGLDSANAGNLIPSAEVEAKFATKRKATRLFEFRGMIFLMW